MILCILGLAMDGAESQPVPVHSIELSFSLTEVGLIASALIALGMTLTKAFLWLLGRIEGYRSQLAPGQSAPVVSAASPLPDHRLELLKAELLLNIQQELSRRYHDLANKLTAHINNVEQDMDDRIDGVAEKQDRDFRELIRKLDDITKILMNRGYN